MLLMFEVCYALAGTAIRIGTYSAMPVAGSIAIIISHKSETFAAAMQTDVYLAFVDTIHVHSFVVILIFLLYYCWWQL